VACVIALIAIFSIVSVNRIEPGHVGIKIALAGSDRGVQNTPLQTGWVFYSPLSSRVYEYPTFVQTAVWSASITDGHPVNEELTFTTKDAMAVSADVSVSYSLRAEKVPSFYAKFRTDDINTFTHGFLRNVARDTFNEAASKYAVEQIMGDNETFVRDVRTRLQAAVQDYGVEIDQFGIIGAPRPPAAVIQAINQKVQATQYALQKQNEVAQAEADARKQVAQAKGEADAQITRAQGEAESNRVRAASLTPPLLELRRLEIESRRVEKWNGTVPQTILGDKGGLLFNVEK
jgi:regulator of protease activity HflC (stomatin/prohibitin superfamily)